jgi:hypothetical protein
MNGQPSAGKKYIYPLSTRLKMRAAKLGKKLTARHKRAIAKGVRSALAKRAVARG